MTHHAKLLHSLILALAIVFAAPLAGFGGPVFGIQAAQAQTVSRIAVDGNKRIDDSTVKSYLTIQVGDQASSSKINSSIDSLYKSGLFSNVSVRYSGGTLYVKVAENPVVASVLFRGNQRFSDKELLSMVDLASRGVFTNDRLSRDEQSIKLAYQKIGYKSVSVNAKTDVLPNSRVRVTFVIDEGNRAGVAAINFTGNNSFSAGQLRGVIHTKQTGWLSWLFRDDTFSQDNLEVDKELLRLFYANHGFPDAQISAVGEFDASRNAYFVNFTVSEGERYKFGHIGIETSIDGLNTDALKSDIKTYKGDDYSAKKLQDTSQEMAASAAGQGFSFADVRPRVDRDIANHVFNITYLVDNGPRVYVQRINIVGNTKTRDFVIRREIPFAEGDPFNRSLLQKAKSDIENLDYFSNVDVSTEPGNAPDKVIINVAVTEKSTGSYGASVGYSTKDGVLGSLSLTERNFLGRGQFLKVSVGASQTGKTYDFSFTEPRFMGLKVSSGIDLYKRVSDETTSSYFGTDAIGGRLRLGMPITDNVNLTTYVGYENKKTSDNKAPFSQWMPGAGTPSEKTMNKGFVGYNLTYSTLDDKKNPTTGLIASLNQEYAGLDHNFLQTQVNARYFMPVIDGSGMVASVRAKAGIINDFSGKGVLPSEAFHSGSGLVRGFAPNGLGPRTENTVNGTPSSYEPIGSTGYAGLSAELEFPMPVLPETYGIKGAVWADMGYISGTPWHGLSDATTQKLRSSVGASIIWDSPFGPLRGDFAKVITKDKLDETQMFQLTMQSLF